MTISRFAKVLTLTFSVLMLTACASGQWPWSSTDADPSEMSEDTQPGNVTDMTAFVAFIDRRPTPDQFRSRYPDVNLVLPGDIATKELRMDNSRYFAELDANGLIIGGQFQ